MKTILGILLLAMVIAPSTQAGTIVGTVRAQGKEEAQGEGASGKYDSRKFKFVERVDYSAMRDFVVYIDQPVPQAAPASNKVVQVVTQKDATFKPRVMTIMAGTTVEWPNRDEIFHNVFSFSEPKQFDLGLYKEEIKKVTFDKPGRVDVFCSIHSQMHCIVLVVQSPFFALTDAKGAYTITNVPAGTYKLKAWHERLPSLVKEITVPEKGEVKVEFTLGVKGLPEY